MKLLLLFTMLKKRSLSEWPLQKWATPNHLPLWKLKMKLPSDFQRLQWNKNAARPLIWDFTGSETGSTITNSWSTVDQVQIMLGTMSLNTTRLLIINQCAQFVWCASFRKLLLVLIQKNVYWDYLNVYSGVVIIPLRIPPLTRNSMASDI